MSFRALGFAIALHLAIYGVFRAWRPGSSLPSETRPAALEVRAVTAEMAGPGIRGSEVGQRSRPKVGRPRVSPSPTLGRFFLGEPWRGAMRPSGETRTGDAQPERSASVDLAVGTGGGAGGPGGPGAAVGVNSPYRSLALALHETLHFEKRLYVEHDAGVVRCRFRVGRDGRLDSRSVRARSAERFLLVYFLQKLEGLFGEDQAERWHGEAWLGREVTVVAQFRAVRARDVRDPWPKIAGDRIELERRRHLPAKLQLGPAEIEALADGKSISGARVGLPLEIESWFSAAHRKRFGWSGTKVLETEERVWRETYDRLYERYVSRGWIEI